MKKDILSAKKIISNAAHRHAEWLSIQVALHEEFGCYMTATKRIVDLGSEATLQVQGDSNGMCFEAFSRVCGAMQTLIEKSQKLEVALTVSAAAASESEHGDAEHDGDAALLAHSCTKFLSSRLACPKDFVGAWCQFHSDNVSTKLKALGVSCNGLCMSGDKSWKKDIPEDADLPKLLDIAGPEINSIDGQVVARELCDLKEATRPCSCVYDSEFGLPNSTDSKVSKVLKLKVFGR